jgi:uncharacterized protein (TIGR01777 family)
MDSRRVVIAGGTGFIGRALSARLQADGYEVVALAWYLEPDPQVCGERAELVLWDGKCPSDWIEHADGAEAIINLVGENISSEEWTPRKKERILNSRVDAARAVVRAVREVKNKPRVVLQGSAMSYYGRHQDEIIDETSGPGEGFFAGVVQQMERAASEVESLGSRFLALRTGVVLGRDGGLLPAMTRSFRRFLGGPNGSGMHWVSWIHIFDLVSAVRFLMDHESLRGAFNLTSPDPLRQRDLCRVLGRAMKRPSWLPRPASWLRYRYGEMAEAVLLTGARVLPTRLLDSGFHFQFPDIEPAVKEILARSSV